MPTMTTAQVIAAKQQAMTQTGKTLTARLAHGGLDNAAAPLGATPQNAHSGGARDIDTDHILAVLTWVRDEIVRRYELRREESR